MYGLSPETDLSFWAGAELVQVAVGRFQVQLHFHGRIALSIESTYRVGTDADAKTFADPPDGAMALIALLGETVAAAIPVGDGTLRLAFGGGSVVEVLDSSDEFESYQITHGADVFVV